MTFVPAQMVPVGVLAIETDGVTFAVTVMVKTLLVAIAGLGQLMLLVINTRMVFPFANVDEV